MNQTSSPLLEVNQLNIQFNESERTVVKSISFSVQQGKITCIVGNSGSGKTLTALSIIGMDPEGANVQGSIQFEGKELLTFSDKQWREVRGKEIFTIFQNPLSSFNPSIKMEKQLYEYAGKRIGMTRTTFKKDMLNILTKMRINEPEWVLTQYPFELSGGMLQRLMIACAVLIKPKLVIADEATTALDVSVQKDILRLFLQLKNEGSTILFISHDFRVVAEIADEVIVMKEGRVVETGNVFQVFDDPKHEFTKQLLHTALRKKEE